MLSWTTVPSATLRAVLFYICPAAIALGFFCLVAAAKDDARRWMRRWSGRCLDCGYPLRGLPRPPGEPRRCPECGRLEP